MDVVQPRHYNRSDHGLVFNAIAYTCGGVYAIGQLAFQGIGKVFVAGWDATYELGSNSISGLNEIGKAFSSARLHVFCVAQMVWGIVSPVFKEPREDIFAFFYEIWKIIRVLPEQVLRLIEVPGSVIGGLIRQLFSDSKAGVIQLGVLVKFVFEIIRQVRDFGTVGAVVKDCIQLIGAGLNEIGKALVAAWKETKIPRNLLLDVLSDLLDCLKSGLGELGKGLDLIGRSVFETVSLMYRGIVKVLFSVLEHVYYGLYQLYKVGDSSIQEAHKALVMILDVLGMWLKEPAAYLLSGICELIKLYVGTKEDLGNSWQNFVVDPIGPYAKQVYDKICEVIGEIEKVVFEIQKSIFG